MTTYIVVADAARARVFTREGLKLEEKESLVHAEGRLHEGDLVTDGGGEVHESMARTSRMAPQPSSSGIWRSKIIKSGARLPARRTASRPLEASATLCPK